MRCRCLHWIVAYLAALTVAATMVGCDPGDFGVSVQVDADLYSAEVTYCGLNVEPIWNPDRTEVLVEPGRALLVTYDVTNLGDEELVVFLKTFRTVDGGAEELFWNSPTRIKPGETVSDFARGGLDPGWGPDTEFECRLELWNM